MSPLVENSRSFEHNLVSYTNLKQIKNTIDLWTNFKTRDNYSKMEQFQEKTNLKFAFTITNLKTQL